MPDKLPQANIYLGPWRGDYRVEFARAVDGSVHLTVHDLRGAREPAARVLPADIWDALFEELRMPQEAPPDAD